MVQDSRRRSFIDARDHLNLCPDLDPNVTSEELIAAINHAAAAGLSHSYLHDAHIILDKKLLLEELSWAIHEERTCDVRVLHTRAQHLGIPDEWCRPPSCC